MVEPCCETLAHGAAAFVYGGAIAVAVQRMKFQDRWDLAGPLGRLFASALQDTYAREPIDLVCPVPLCARRLRERGFNQAALLATELASAWGLRRSFGSLARIRETPVQSLSTRAQRQVQLGSAFAARGVQGRTILLVDDVRTTGATIAECTRALKQAGALRVCFATLAQTP